MLMRRGTPKAAVANQSLPDLPLPDGISAWSARDLDDLKRQVLLGATEAEPLKEALFTTIDVLGARSQLAQGLTTPLTTVHRMHENDTYRLYLLTHDRHGLAILKVGVKRLFLTHPTTQSMVEVEPRCVLDFYVEESSQRRGYGKQLFEEMLKREAVATPSHLAIDRPSPKLLTFLSKHYGLSSYTPNVNNFVVFHSFFDHTTVTERGQLRRRNGSGAEAAAATPSSKKGNPNVAYSIVGRGGAFGYSDCPVPPAYGKPLPPPSFPIQDSVGGNLNTAKEYGGNLLTPMLSLSPTIPSTSTIGASPSLSSKGTHPNLRPFGLHTEPQRNRSRSTSRAVGAVLTMRDMHKVKFHTSSSASLGTPSCLPRGTSSPPGAHPLSLPSVHPLAEPPLSVLDHRPAAFPNPARYDGSSQGVDGFRRPLGAPMPAGGYYVPRQGTRLPWQAAAPLRQLPLSTNYNPAQPPMALGSAQRSSPCGATAYDDPPHKHHQHQPTSTHSSVGYNIISGQPW